MFFLHISQRDKEPYCMTVPQEAAQILSCKNEDFSRVLCEKPSNKPSFQIHVDEPDGAKKPPKPQQVVQPAKAKPVVEESPLVIDNAVVRLRQPLSTLDIPSAMEVSFGE